MKRIGTAVAIGFVATYVTSIFLPNFMGLLIGLLLTALISNWQTSEDADIVERITENVDLDDLATKAKNVAFDDLAIRAKKILREKTKA